MDDETILQRGGGEHEIEQYSKINGANLTKEDFMHPLNQKLIELLPDLKELTFGCEVKSNNTSKKRYYLGRNDEEIELYWFEEGQVEYNDSIFFTEGNREDVSSSSILGRPPQLADVLRAIGIVRPDEADKWGVDANGLISRVPLWEDRQTLKFYWNLSLGLNDQPESTKQFILSILNK